MFIQGHDSINFIESVVNNDHGFINNVHGSIINDHGSTIKSSWFHHHCSRLCKHLSLFHQYYSWFPRKWSRLHHQIFMFLPTMFKIPQIMLMVP